MLMSKVVFNMPILSFFEKKKLILPYRDVVIHNVEKSYL